MQFAIIELSKYLILFQTLTQYTPIGGPYILYKVTLV